MENGAWGGFGGFTYYSETTRFFKRNKKEIMELAEELAADLGVDVLTLIGSFNILKDEKLSPYDIALAIEGKNEYADEVQNALSWFALEETARAIVEEER